MIDAGKLNERILLSWPVNQATGAEGYSAPNTYGVVGPANSQPIALRAQLLSYKSEQFQHASGTINRDVLIFRIRFVDGLHPGNGVIFNGQNFIVTSIAPIGRRNLLDLTVITGPAQ